MDALSLVLSTVEVSVMRQARVVVFLITVFSVVGASAEHQVDTRTFRELVKPVLSKYCVDCHGPFVQEARRRFDQIDGFESSGRHLWTMIHEQLSKAKMPPKGESQLSPSVKKQVLAWIEKEQRALEPGSTRRLNRRELGSALRDVTGVNVDFAYTLPGDSKVNGFDTGAEALQDAADSVSQMMEVTRRAVEAIRFLEPPPSEILKVDLVNVAKEPNRQFDAWKAAGVYLEKLPRIAMPGMGALVEPKWAEGSWQQPVSSSTTRGETGRRTSQIQRGIV